MFITSFSQEKVDDQQKQRGPVSNEWAVITQHQEGSKEVKENVYR